MPAPLTLATQRWALLQLHSLSKKLGRAPKLPPHLQTGVRGEFEALFYLRRLGYTVVERRWRSPELNGDLDLVAWEGATLCFIEVKTRSSEDWTRPAAAVNAERRWRLSRAALDYLRLLENPRVKIRFDIVEVLLAEGKVREVRHLPNTFAMAQPLRYG